MYLQLVLYVNINTLLVFVLLGESRRLNFTCRRFGTQRQGVHNMADV